MVVHPSPESKRGPVAFYLTTGPLGVNNVDPTKRPFEVATREVVHSTQARRVADSVMHETGHEVYRRRLLGGTDACAIRTSVRNAVMESLRDTRTTHTEAAEAGALAADHALAQVGVQVEKFGFQRTAWRDRIAHALVTLEAGNTTNAITELQVILDRMNP